MDDVLDELMPVVCFIGCVVFLYKAVSGVWLYDADSIERFIHSMGCLLGAFLFMFLEILMNIRSKVVYGGK